LAYPKKLDREKEPHRDLLELVTNEDKYTKKSLENGEEIVIPMRINFKSEESAKYIRKRLYRLFSGIREEFKHMPELTPRLPRISRSGSVLTFTLTEGKKKTITWNRVQ